ncbi:MAG: helix-turn-helix transcriptional regulator [Spirochaetaceae bacterium]|nr:helix-turn-helix transcriptional regulator [Spirochaetaceae bacterium]
MAPNDAGLATRERILDAAMALAGREGMARLTTRRVAGEAGVNVGLLHYHFGSKDDLVRAVLERWQADIREVLDRAARTAAEERPAAGDEEILVAALGACLDYSFARPGLVFGVAGMIVSDMEGRVGGGAAPEGRPDDGATSPGIPPFPPALPIGPLQYVLQGRILPLLRSRLGGDEVLVSRRALQLFASVFHPALFTPLTSLVFGLDLSDKASRDAYVRGVVANALAPPRPKGRP